jgi:hypothetical protein
MCYKKKTPWSESASELYRPMKNGPCIKRTRVCSSLRLPRREDISRPENTCWRVLFSGIWRREAGWKLQASGWNVVSAS